MLGPPEPSAGAQQTSPSSQKSTHSHPSLVQPEAWISSAATVCSEAASLQTPLASQKPEQQLAQASPQLQVASQAKPVRVQVGAVGSSPQIPDELQ